MLALLSSSSSIVPRSNTGDLRSIPSSNEIAGHDAINSNFSRNHLNPNPLGRPFNIVSTSVSGELRFRSPPGEEPRPDIIIVQRPRYVFQSDGALMIFVQGPQPHNTRAGFMALRTASRPIRRPRASVPIRKSRRGLDPWAKIFVPSSTYTPPLFTSPYNISDTPETLPELTPDRKRETSNVPSRTLNYGPESARELSPEEVRSIKAELVRPPPIIVPSEHKKRATPGLFLYGPPPPGLARHSAYSPYHIGGVLPLPLPPTEILWNPSTGHVSFHSQWKASRLGKDRIMYPQGCSWMWEFNSSHVLETISPHVRDSLFLG